MQQVNVSHRRLHYIDALRGFGILCVVYHHLIVMGMRDSGYESPVNHVIMMFFMPLFFFISGFVNYKRQTSKNDIVKALRKNICRLLIPTIVMFSVCMIYFNLDPIEWVFASMKSGYWFTWTLFWITMLWVLLDVCLHDTRFLGGVISLLLYVASFKLDDRIPLVGLSSANLICANCIFYVMGIYFRRNEDVAWRLLCNKYVSLAILLLACLPLFAHLHGPLALIGKSAQVVALLLVFRHFADFFGSPNRAARMICTIGTHTISIYFLHYFLLFKVDFLCTWFNDLEKDYCFRGHSCVFLVELLTVGAVSLLLCYVSILLEKSFRPFRLVHRLCFGTGK